MLSLRRQGSNGVDRVQTSCSFHRDPEQTIGLDGLAGVDGSPAPSTPEEAKLAGEQARARGDELCQVVFSGLSRYPGTARQIAGLISSAAAGWFGSQQETAAPSSPVYTAAILARRGSGHDQWLRVDTAGLRFIFEDDETGRIVEALTVAEMKTRFPFMAVEVGNAIASVIRGR
jgi:hypothetical protein